MKNLLFPTLSIAAAMMMNSLYAQTDSTASSGGSGSSSSGAGAYNDPVTGAKVICISPGIADDACVIYFTQPCITPDGKYAVVREQKPDAGHTAGLMYRYEFATGALVKITDRMTRNQVMFAATGNVYYSSDNDTAYYVTNIYDNKTRKIADLPTGFTCTAGVTVNADESVMVGTCELTKTVNAEPHSNQPPNQGPGFAATLAAHNTNMLVSAEIKTGKVTVIHKIDTWLGHVQFSPKDRDLLMYCHEGPWDKVDRIWTLRLSNPVPQLVLKRTKPNEMAGHEFWSVDGSTSWYDHGFRNSPGLGHWLEGKNLTTGVVTRYTISPEWGSIHYTQSPDGKFFVCDGGPRKNANDQAMYALVPNGGKLDPVKLCSMAKNNYKAAEPNPHLTADQHLCIFTATFGGKSAAYAVEMPKQFWR